MPTSISATSATVTRLACFSFLAATSLAEGQAYVNNARVAGLGRSTAALSGLHGVRANPASMAGARHAAVMFGFGQSHGLSELQSRSLDVVFPIGAVRAGLGLSVFGYEAFSLTGFSAGIAQSVGEFDVGLRIDAENASFDRYDSRSGVRLSAGWICRLVSAVEIGGTVRNVGGRSIGRPGRALTLSMGVLANPSEYSRLLASATVSPDIGLDARLGFELSLLDAILIRTGVTTNPGKMAAGFGLRISLLRIDFAYVHHPALGGSPVVTLEMAK